MRDNNSTTSALSLHPLILAKVLLPYKEVFQVFQELCTDEFG
ncbi:hypothetical protein GXM_07515 [Nostoc sphaeroides CCNUC1]|uniref:Uncharacterized protein n=1 Tax=Nostoc sphaeroides CCNUC1 TaxID=2653204 RepID=A0A5P8WBU8_9NOSO|nr:hypothetical protein GXM_07515 [Nostoc sphaeroides CCNUC1]